MKTEFEKLVECPETRFGLCVECTIVDIAEHICKLLEEHKMTRADLAMKMGVTPGRVSQLLSGEANMKLSTVAKAFAAFDRILDVRSRRIDESFGEGERPRYFQVDFQKHVGEKNVHELPHEWVFDTTSQEKTLDGWGPLNMPSSPLPLKDNQPLRLAS
ncbi:XRE family transcriptional regulator [Candidatus Parcubacteria bacterium]|nr:MAG: XRE family transcriptional regulator [Candidatus Parcubacteria bacterium]